MFSGKMIKFRHVGDLISYEDPVTDQREWSYNGRPNLYHACQQAVALHWDGCHTIALILDSEALYHFLHSPGLERRGKLSDKEFFNRVEGLYTSSVCSLRRIEAHRTPGPGEPEENRVLHLIPEGTWFKIGTELLAD